MSAERYFGIKIKKKVVWKYSIIDKGDMAYTGPSTQAGSAAAHKLAL